MNINNYTVDAPVFTDNKQIQCEFIAIDNTTNKGSMMVCDCDPSDQWWALVQKDWTLDQIKKNTTNQVAEQDEAFKLYAIESGKSLGYLYDPDVANPNNRLILENIFTKPEGTKGDDLLFEVKLRVFDIQEVIDSTDETLKTRLRETDNIMEALWIAGQFLGFK